MIFTLLFFVVACAAQGFVQPELIVESTHGGRYCKNPAASIPYKFSEVMMHIDEVREVVSSAATDAYARGHNVGEIITCFTDEVDAYIDLGEELSIMVHNTSLAVMKILKNKSHKYEKLLEEPLHIISETLKELPGRVLKLITHMHFLKAFKAVREARRIIDENARQVAEIVHRMAHEIPELGEKIYHMITEIYQTVEKQSESIKKSFYECILNQK